MYIFRGSYETKSMFYLPLNETKSLREYLTLSEKLRKNLLQRLQVKSNPGDFPVLLQLPLQKTNRLQ